MADSKNLMRPLRSDSLKPRPSTQAVWEPRAAAPMPSAAPQHEPAVPQTPPAPAPIVPEEPVSVPEPTPMPVQTPVSDPEPLPEPEPLSEPEALPELEPQQEIWPADETEEEPLPDPALFELFAPAVTAPQPMQPVPQPEAADDFDLDAFLASVLGQESVPPAPAYQPDPQPVPAIDRAQAEDDFDLDALIASILSDGEPEEEEEAPAGQDALPTSDMPSPAFVPLYEESAPKPRKKPFPWLWLILLLIAAGVATAWHFGLLDEPIAYLKDLLSRIAG